MSATITVAAPPSTNTVAAQILASMAALSGVITDFNSGSQIRTTAESLGSIVEMQGVAVSDLALQAFAYSAIAAFGIIPAAATFAAGTVTYSTAPATLIPPPALQDVAIPAGSLVQTASGIQFQTVVDAVLASGTTSISVAAIATIGGSTSNVLPGAINQSISGLGYPIFVTNGAKFQGGAPAETISAALARFSAKVGSLGLSSPVAVANAAIGVSASGTSETVAFAACYEPWVTAGSGAGSGTAGFTVYVDNGAGAASSGLITAVTTQLNGNVALNLSGYRPAGVPYSIQPVSPVYANVTITGASTADSSGAAVSGGIAAAVQSYFEALVFAAPSEQSQIAASASNAAPGLLTALTVSLFLSGSSSAVAVITGGPSNRIILNNLVVAIVP
jgi:hypothetical protein